MMKKTTFLKVAAALAGSLVLFACDPIEPKVTELSVSDKSVSFETDGGEKTVTVTCNTTWSVNSTADWFTVSPKSGSENGSIKITATANNAFNVRSGDITVTAGDKSQTIKVNQLSLSPSLLIDPTATEVPYAGGEVVLKITSNAPWTLTVPEGITWITADKTSGEGSADVQVTVLENLDRETRSAKIAVKETINGTTQELTITQELAPQSRRSDSLALVAIYNLADGAHWKDSRLWKLDEPIDTWPGIKLNEAGRVIEMSITNGTITTVEWEIPEVLTELTELSTLQIVGSKLKGEIPDFLYGMTKLAKIRFNTNSLTGALSDKISQWTDLTELYLNGNKDLGGTIPATIGQLKKLESINIAQTSIGGEIPQALAECTALKNFMAYSNKLSGEIPDFWDKLPDIGVLQLYGNPDITGPIPASIGTLKKATGIQLKDCNLTGNIPASFGGLEKCGNLMLSGNKLEGIVPAEVQAHPKWQATTGWKYETNILPQQDGYVLRLHPDYRQLDSLALVAVYNAAKGETWTKGNWDLSKPMTEWTGVTLTDGRVTALKLTTTVAIPSEWTLPEDIADLTALTDLRINKQKLSGGFPAVLCRMPWLKVLYLQGNNFTGALPAELGQMTELTDLYVDQNASMSGSIPHEIGNLKKLQRINISQSGIGGEIPAELGQCEELLQFMAFKCNLSGTLPDIWDLPKLQTVMLHTNPGLTGNLPSSLSKLKPIVKGTTVTAPSLQLQGCNFTGNIPESFAQLHENTKQVFVQENKMSGVIPAAVQAHPNFSSWKYKPQQEGYELTLE